MIFEFKDGQYVLNGEALTDNAPNLTGNIKSDKEGYLGEVEVMYATHKEVFDSLSPNSLREKNFEFILLKRQQDLLKQREKTLKTEILNIQKSLEGTNTELDGGTAGKIQFKEEKKISYTKEAVAELEKLINQVQPDNKVFKNEVSAKGLKDFEKAHPELHDKINALKTVKTELKILVAPNPEFVMPTKDALDEMFKEDHAKAESERFAIYTKVHALAEKEANKTMNLSEAEVFKSQMEILKDEWIAKVKEDEINRNNKDLVDLARDDDFEVGGMN